MSKMLEFGTYKVIQNEKDEYEVWRVAERMAVFVSPIDVLEYLLRKLRGE